MSGTRLAAVMLAGGLLAGCASSGNGGADTRFERAVGTGSVTDVLERSMKVLRQHQFEIQQQMDAPNIYIETKWRARVPFDDEVVIGVRLAQTRAIVRAKPRGTGGMGETYAVDVTIENRVQRTEGSDWLTDVATPLYRKYADQITSDFRNELTIGVRKY